MKLNKLIIIIFFALTFNMNAEDKMIHGNVYGTDESGEKIPLIGVRVQWLGSDEGGLSNSNGHFMFDKVEGKKHLVFQYVGYKTDTLHLVDLNKFINHTMTSMITDEVIVERQKPNKIYDSSIEAKETITRQALSHIACCNLSEAFESDPSVSLQYSDPVSGAKRIRLMGLDGKYSQVMVEKMPFLRGLNIPYGLSFIPGPWIESISISKGTADVTNGFENMTGQINVELKKPFIESSLVNAFVDIGGRTEVNATENFNVKQNINSVVMLHASVIPNYSDLNNDNFSDRPKTQSFNFMNKYQFENTAGDRVGQIGVRALYDNRESQLNNVVLDNIVPFSFNIDNSRAELFFKNGYNFGTSNLGMTGSVVYQNNNSMNNFSRYNNEFNLSHYNANFNINYIDGLGTSPTESETVLNYGFSFLYDNFTNQFIDSSNFSSSPKLEYITPGVFANFKYTKLENIDLSFGVRADYNKLNDVFFTPRALLKITPTDKIDIRINAGKGFRYNNAFSENIYLFFYDIDETYLANVMNFQQNKMEEAWNYGITANWNFKMFEKTITINGEYYKTDFINRVIVDQYRYTADYLPQIYESDKTSFSESFGFDVDIPFTDDIAFTSSVRYDNTFFTNQKNELIREPLTSVFKSMTNLYITLPWELSLRTTGSYYGWGKRTLPEGSGYKNFDPFWLFSAQLNKKFESLDLEIYIGSENITSYSILEANTDLQAIGANYIGTDLWGPLMGRNIYFGINWTGF